MGNRLWIIKSVRSSKAKVRNLFVCPNYFEKNNTFNNKKGLGGWVHGSNSASEMIFSGKLIFNSLIFLHAPTFALFHHHLKLIVMTRAFPLFHRILLLGTLVLFYFSSEAVTCKNGITVSLDQDGQVVLFPSDVILNTNTCCNIEEVTEIFDYNSSDFKPNATFNCNDLGQQPLKIRVTDCFGNQTYCETYAVIQGQFDVCEQGCGTCCLPYMHVRSFITALSENGKVTLSADWFDDGSVSQCSGGSLKFSFSQNPDDTIATLSCDDIGQLPFQIWATDPDGNQAMAETYVITQANFMECDGIIECRPQPVILNGIVLSLQADGTACISVDAFDADSQPNPCIGGGTSYSLAFSSDPSNTLACFDCDDLGQQPLEIYIFDNLGTINTAYTYVIIEYFNNDDCEPLAIVPVNDDVCNAIPLDPLYAAECSTAKFHNINATNSASEIAPPLDDCNEPNTWCDASGAENTVWFKFEAPIAHTVYITATGMNTQLALWDAENCSAILTGDATLVVANDDDPSLAGGGSLIAAECLVVGKTYYLQVDGHNNEEDFFDLTLSYEGTDCTSSSQEVLGKLEDFKVMPNPASHVVGIYLNNWSSNSGGDLIISDISGKVVLTIPFERTSQKFNFNTEQLSSGIYFAQLQANGIRSSAKKLAIAH